MSIGNPSYIFRKFKNKTEYYVDKSFEIYDPTTGDITKTEETHRIRVLPLSLDLDSLPENCLSTDKSISILTRVEIDTSDKIRTRCGKNYNIKYIKQTSFDPIIYGAIIRDY
jgi:hypothetical protein